jgi:hypothetical protein
MLNQAAKPRLFSIARGAADPPCLAILFATKKRQIAVQKYFQKSEKKSLSAFKKFNKRESAATNRAPQAFKNIFKKVKKKLVSA